MPVSVKHCGVIGKPVEHSMSPQIHSAYARQCGLSMMYIKIECAPEEFSEKVDHLFNQGMTGLNVTLPHKETAFQLCDFTTERAKLSGSVNTLWKNEEGSLKGDTTDGQGFIEHLKWLNWFGDLSALNILILGAGGAARSIIPQLLQLGASITLLNRTSDKAQRLLNQFSTLGNIQVFKDDSNNDFDLVVNTMSEQGELYLEQLPQGLFPKMGIYDISYGTRAEAFKQACQAKHCAAYSDGWGMLVSQAALSFEIWHGFKPNTKTLIESGYTSQL